MAFNFIKKVFSFGSNKVEETLSEDAEGALAPLDLEAGTKTEGSAADSVAHDAVAQAEREAALRLEQEAADKLARDADEKAKLDAELEAEAERIEAEWLEERRLAAEAAEREQAAAAELEAARIAAEERRSREAAEAEAARRAREQAEREAEQQAALDAQRRSEAENERLAAAELEAARIAAEERRSREAAEAEAVRQTKDVARPASEAETAPAVVTPDFPPVMPPAPVAEVQPPIREPEPPAAGTPVAALPAEPPKPAAGKVTVAKSVEAKAEPIAAAPAPKLSWFQRMRAGLSRSSQQLSASITGVFTKKKLDEDTLQDLEDVLIRADLGVETALRVTDTLAATRMGRDISDAEVRGVMATEIEKVLKPVAMPLELDLSHKPHVILVVGVNGTGKTTTIGKLAAKLTQGGLNVMLAAGDTFRAAAIEQLKIWGERTKSPVISSKLGADAAGLAYDAFEKAKEAGADVLIIDTAGRLQNRTELMAELEKIVRVLGKLDPDAPHTVLQTVDATTGQNALNQVEIFRNVAGVNGLVMTKLDGTARGGILVAIAAKHKLPVYFIGVGEQVDDLEPFSANEFARAIAGVA